MGGGQRKHNQLQLQQQVRACGNRSSQAPRRTYLLAWATATLGLAGGIGALIWFGSKPILKRTGAHQLAGRARQAEPSAHSPDHGGLFDRRRRRSARAGRGNWRRPFRGPPTAHALLLARVDPAGALRAADPSADLAVSATRRESPRSRSRSCIEERAAQPWPGTPVAALLRLEIGQPQRYVVVAPGRLCASRLDGLGGAWEMKSGATRCAHDKDPEFEWTAAPRLQNFQAAIRWRDWFAFLEPSLAKQVAGPSSLVLERPSSNSCPALGNRISAARAC